VSEKKRGDEVGRDEIDEHNAEKLPDRELMSLLGGPVAIPLDPGIAADVLSGDAFAGAGDPSTADIDQTEGGTNGEEA